MSGQIVKHYHAMNGNIGCIPDNNDVYYDFDSAVEGVKQLFELTDDQVKELTENWILYDNKAAPLLGAEYCEIAICYDEDCLSELD